MLLYLRACLHTKVAKYASFLFRWKSINSSEIFSLLAVNKNAFFFSKLGIIKSLFFTKEKVSPISILSMYSVKLILKTSHWAFVSTAGKCYKQSFTGLEKGCYDKLKNKAAGGKGEFTATTKHLFFSSKWWRDLPYPSHS